MSDSEMLAVSAVQEWMDESDVSCGMCGSSSLIVVDTKYSEMMERFDEVSPHRAELECDNCGEVSENSLMWSVVESIEE